MRRVFKAPSFAQKRTRHVARKIDAERFLVEIQHRLLTGAYIAPEAARVTFDAYSRQYVGRQPWRASSAQVAEFGLGHARRVFGTRPLGSIREATCRRSCRRWSCLRRRWGWRSST